MRHATSFSTIADCLRPGFARHRALSRPRQWTVAATSTPKRSVQTSAWGEASLTHSNDKGYYDEETRLEVPAEEEPLSPPVKRTRWSILQSRLEEKAQQKEQQTELESDAKPPKDQRLSFPATDGPVLVETAPHKLRRYEGNRYDDPEEFKALLRRTRTQAVYQRMRFSALRGETLRTREIASFLLSEREAKPDLALYSSLIRSQCNNASGSVLWAKSYLEELLDEGLEPDSGICHDLLKVLSIHPHYVLRSEILDYMRQRWLTLSSDGHHDVAAGLFREGQLERATEVLDNMSETGIEVQSWLYDLAIYQLCNAGEVGEALRLLQIRVASTKGGEVSSAMWSTMLEVSSEAVHYEGTAYVWNRRVKHAYLNPPSGVCSNVLKIAARHGDVDLATDVFRVLSERGNVFDAEQYEMLLEAYISAKDVPNSLTLLCVMHDAEMHPDLGTVRSLVVAWRNSPSTRSKALEMMRQLRNERTVPIVAMHALIEAACEANEVEEAIEYYKCMHEVCEPPSRNVDTFNILLRGCRFSHRKDVAMFLASEMVAMGVKPNMLTYDRLILVCVNDKYEYEDGFQYYFEMVSQGYKARLGTIWHLARQAALAGDPRTRRLLEDLDGYGLPAQKIRAMVEQILRSVETRKLEERSPESQAESVL